MNSIKQRAKRLVQAARRWAGRGLSALRRVRSSRIRWGRVGYYAALALLLTLLGSASWAFRARRQQASELPSESRRAAISVRAPTQSIAPEPTPEPIVWQWPLEGEIVGEYAPDAPVWSRTLEQWQTHAALDIAGSPGEAVYACRAGTVADAWSDRLWGNTVVIEHEDGYRSTYAGLNTLQMAAVGDAVEAGQVIGSVGQSAACEADLGWHLHFELTRNGAPVDFSSLAPAGSD